MNKYKNRYSTIKILTDNELSDFAQICILVCIGKCSPMFSRNNNSHPSDVVILRPNQPASVMSQEINSTQWNEVLKPVVERISPLIGLLPNVQDIELGNVRIGREVYVTVGVGSLFDRREGMFIDLVKKMIIKQAKDKGYGT